MRNNLFKQVNSLIDKKTEKVSSPVMPSLGNNQNVLGAPIIVDSGSTAKIEQLNNDINLIKTNIVGIPERILSGMEVKAVGGSVVSINSGSVYTKKGVFELSKQSSYRIDVSKQETQYIVIDNGILKTSNEISDDVLLIAKIVINVIGDEIDDNANADYSNNYIVSGRDLAVNPQFEIDDDTRLVMSNILQEILASNLVGTIRLNEGLDITNQQDSVRLTSTGMGIYNDDVKFAEFIRDGIYFYNESGLMLSQYTKDGATIGNINILPDSIESTNFKSGNRGFQINSNGNVEFNNITARGTIVARDGLIGGVTIANQGLYVGINQFSSSFTPFYLDKQGRFSLGDKLTWDGTTLNIVGGLSVDWIDVTDSTGKKPSDNADVTTTAIGAGVVTTGRIELQNNSSVTGAGIRGGGTAGTEIRLWAGSTLASAASAPFRVTHDGALVASNATIKGAITATSGSFTGSITSTSGTIAGWDIQSTVLRSVVSASASRIELDKGNNRISIFDATNEKVVMGYLNGLPKNDGSGNYGAGDYGLLIRTGNKLSIDGGGEYFSGEYFIRNDASYLIKDAADKTIIRLGTDTGEKGLFIYNTAGTQLAKLISDKIFIGESTKYLQYTTAGGLDVKGNITITSGSGISNLTDAGALATMDESDIDTSAINNDAGWTDDTVANSKIKTFYQTSIPTSVTIGDLWYDTDAGNKCYRAEMVGANEIKAGEWVAVPVDFANVNGGTKPENNATVGANWSTNLSNIPTTLGTPSGSGLFLSSNYMGYYTGGTWKTYIDNSGNMILGNPATGAGMSWNQGTAALTVRGTITADSGTFNGTVNANAGNFTSTVTIGSGATSGTLAVGTDTNKITIVGTNSQTTTKIYAGIGTYGNSNTGFYADASGRFSLKDKLTFSASTLTITGNVTANSLTANTAGSIAGWTLTAGKLASGNVGMQPATYPFYAGNATASSAPFRVDTSGNLTATTVSLSGGLTIGNTGSIQTANKTSYADTDAGIWLGYDTSAYKLNIGNDTDYVKWTGTNLEIKGNITADSGSIGGLTVESDKMYLGDGEYANIDTPFYVDDTGQFSLNDRFQWDGENLSILIDSLNDWFPYAVPTEGWRDVVYGNGKFVAIAGVATGEGDGYHRCITSDNDGIDWIHRFTPSAGPWMGIAYGNGLFVACASTTGTNSIMTSKDGINWSLVAVTGYNWNDVTYGNGKFVVVGDSYVTISTDGITWNTYAVTSYDWEKVTYGNGVFVAMRGQVLGSGVNNIIYSTDGVTWSDTTGQTGRWQDITYGNGKFVMVSQGGDNYIQTSTDGITWTAQTPSENNSWKAVIYGNDYYVAVAASGINRVMISQDGINWISAPASEDNSWYGIAYGNGKFVAVSYNGTNRVMRSGIDSISTNKGFTVGTIKSPTENPTKFFNTDNIEVGTLCRAWVNFNGTANINLVGLYERSGTTVTITTYDSSLTYNIEHNLIIGNSVYLDFTSGSATDGIFVVTDVIDDYTFTITHGTSGSTSGNVTIRRNTIRASFNVSSITDNGTGKYTINFINPMPDTNYCVQIGNGLNAVSNAVGNTALIVNNSSVTITHFENGNQTDVGFIYVAVFR